MPPLKKPALAVVEKGPRLVKNSASDKPKGKRGRKPKAPLPYNGPAFGLEAADIELIALDQIALDDQTFQFRLTAKAALLEDTVRNHGIQIPVTLRKHPSREGVYQIVSGFRRTTAAKNVGKTHVPAVVRDLTDEEAYLHAFAENEFRRTLRDLDRAVGISKLRSDKEWTTRQLAEFYRMSERQVQRLERLLDFEDELKEALDEERIETTHATVLHQAKKKKPLLDLGAWIKKIAAEKLSVEALVLALKVELPRTRGKSGLLKKNDHSYTFNLRQLHLSTQDDKAEAIKTLRDLLRRFGAAD